MLGRPRMDIQDAIREYIDLCDKVFAQPRPIIRPKYNTSRMAKILQEIVKRRCGKIGEHDEDWNKFRQEDHEADLEMGRRCLT